jgi:hypothetical protein
MTPMTDHATRPITCLGCRHLLERRLGGSRLYRCGRFDPPALVRGAIRHGKGNAPRPETDDCWRGAPRPPEAA